MVPDSRDRAGVIRALATMRSVEIHRPLEAERGIPRELLANPGFADRILADARSNAVFPDADKDGPCGCKIEKRSFTGFAPGGEKGCRTSRVRSVDNALTIAESAIDFLSHAVLHPDENTRQASFLGAANPKPTSSRP